MRAPVYRHVEAQSTIAGLTLTSFAGLLGVTFAAIRLLNFGGSLAVVLGAYLAVRIAGHGRPPQFWQHWLVWHLRRRRFAGRLSAAARAKTPSFRFGPTLYRDRT
jgi:hypothetical protein